VTSLVTDLRVAATFNAAPEFRAWVEQNPIRPGKHSGSARAAPKRRTIYILDVLADPEYLWDAKDVEVIRTILTVPILKRDDLLQALPCPDLQLEQCIRIAVRELRHVGRGERDAVEKVTTLCIGGIGIVDREHDAVDAEG